MPFGLTTRRPAAAPLTPRATAATLALAVACAPDRPATLSDDPLGSHVEQTVQGERPPARLVASFDGLGAGFHGPHGRWQGCNPSDNSLAVGPDHIVQTVNSRLAVFSKRGARFDTTGTVLYGPVPTHTVLRGFGGSCEERNNGDAVVRYDQLAGRWLIVMPLFRRSPARPDQPGPWTSDGGVYLSPPGVSGQPGEAVALPAPPPRPPKADESPPPRRRPEGRPPAESGPYSMCYAVSVGPDPMGPYRRYEFLRPLFPDYPRPALWPDGYYVTTSTGDDVIQKHACVVDRRAMLAGAPATEQCLVLDGVGFLNNVDLDGQAPPPDGAPNLMMATGGARLHGEYEGTYAPDRFYRWMASPAVDRLGNVGIGYSFGGTPHHPGQRFAGRLHDDPPGVLTLRERVLMDGEGSQTVTNRWQDYTQTAVDPTDDCTIWYVGDYYRKDAETYSTRIGAFRMPGCTGEGTDR